MEMINHINYPNKKNEVYCRFKNKIIKLDKDGKYWDTCSICPLFSGDYQGEGIECSWNDSENNEDTYVSDPQAELLRVSEMIDNGDKNYSKQDIKIH
jgi:hypothetical protein